MTTPEGYPVPQATTIAQFFRAIPMAVFDTSGLTGTFQALNGSGFSAPIKMVKFYNGSNTGITVSYNTVNGMVAEDFFPAGATEIRDLQANHQNKPNSAAGTFNGSKGQILYGMGPAGVGNFYIIGFY